MDVSGRHSGDKADMNKREFGIEIECTYGFLLGISFRSFRLFPDPLLFFRRSSHSSDVEGSSPLFSSVLEGRSGSNGKDRSSERAPGVEILAKRREEVGRVVRRGVRGRVGGTGRGEPRVCEGFRGSHSFSLVDHETAVDEISSCIVRCDQIKRMFERELQCRCLPVWLTPCQYSSGSKA